MIDASQADFGLLGSDKYDESDSSATFEAIGPLACRFALAVPKDRDINSDTPNSGSLRIATSYPRSLANFAAQRALAPYATVQYPGKVEGTVGLGIADAVYDIRESGDSMRDNDLTVLYDGPPVILGGVWQETSEIALPAFDTSAYLDSLAVIEDKAARIRSGEAPSTYTEKLMSNINELVKKLGSEQAEFLQAILRLDTDPDEVLNEAADFVYAVTVALSVKKLSMISVLNILAGRNNRPKS